MPKSTLTLESVVAQSSDIVGSSIDRKVALMSIQNGAYYGMDAVGSRIWELVKNPCRITMVCDHLVEEYQVGRPQCEEQVLSFLQKLADADLLRIC